MGHKLSEEDTVLLKKNIVKKLYDRGAFSKGHMLFERLQTGIPPHLKGFVKEALEKLMREEIVLLYGKTKHGDAYQLNTKKLKEIEAILEIKSLSRPY